MKPRTTRFNRLPARLALYGALCCASLGCTETSGPPQPEEWKFDTAELLVRNHEVEVKQAPLDGNFFAWQSRLKSTLKELFDLEETANSSTPTIVSREPLPAPQGLIRHSILFESFDGTRITAILQQPESSENLPALVVIPGHTRENESGLLQLVYEAESYQRAAATALAQAGFVTITFELRGFGLLGSVRDIDHKQVAYNAILDGTFYKALVVKDALSALEILAAEPSVDETRIGATGASLGGEIAVAVSALSESVKALAFSSYGGSVGPFGRTRGSGRKQPHYCHIVPGSGKFMNRQDWILLSAPRPVAGFRGEHGRARSVDFYNTISPYWKLMGSYEHFQFDYIHEGGHNFFVERTVKFFRENL